MLIDCHPREYVTRLVVVLKAREVAHITHHASHMTHDTRHTSASPPPAIRQLSCVQRITIVSNTPTELRLYSASPSSVIRYQLTLPADATSCRYQLPLPADATRRRQKPERQGLRVFPVVVLFAIHSGGYGWSMCPTHGESTHHASRTTQPSVLSTAYYLTRSDQPLLLYEQHQSFLRSTQY